MTHCTLYGSWISKINFYKMYYLSSCRTFFLAGLHARAFLRKCGNLPIRENLVITWPYARPTVHTTGQPMFSHFLASLGAQGKTDCSSMLWSIDSCQNRVSADQYPLTTLWAQVSTHRGRVFFTVIRWQNPSFQMIAGSSFFYNWYKVCCVYVNMTSQY